MTEEQFNLLLAEIKEVKKDLAEIKKNMVTGDESLAASGTLQQIAENLATSAAAKAEDKAEAGFTILSSLFIGLENRIMNRSGGRRCRKQLHALKLKNSAAKENGSSISMRRRSRMVHSVSRMQMACFN
jgi:hypothetical protein